MRLLIYVCIDVLIIGLFLYSKLLPHKARLTGSYAKTFNFFEKIFDPILNFLRKLAQPAQVGNGIAVDMSQIILLVLFLILLKVIL